ncbi:hypothetical protein KUW09_24630 [Mameliella alba]|nr:hypothetical protein [Antarctobacter heliothermus]MBY6147258.1 hypothetical protein [Mameliella alba]MCA0957292.1 hypothetical protein [Mameliella alba]
MSRTVSITARRHDEAQHSDEVEVLLMQFEHADLEAPIRISSDATRLSVDPLLYGTRSTWNGADPATEPYLFAFASYQMPGDQEDAPAAVRVILDLFDDTLVKKLRSTITPATAHLAVVYAASPNTVEIEYRGLEIGDISYGEQLVITSSRRAIEERGVPRDLMTKDRFPGLFR